MQRARIILGDSEKGLLEFHLFRYRGAQNAMEQFLYTHEFEYNEEHYQRLVNTYLDLYAAAQKYILDIVVDRGYTLVDFNTFAYNYANGELTVNF